MQYLKKNGKFVIFYVVPTATWEAKQKKYLL